MFKHILIPTDGSEISAAAIEYGVRFAKEINAKITGITVTTPFHIMAVESISVLNDSRDYDARAKARAMRNLDVIKDAATNAGVEFDLVHASGEHPYEEIVRTAEEKGCDIIFQASHGRRGMQALLMGSETTKVLTHSKIPVLVYR